MWGVGTALGELPPYFVTRAAKRAGQRAGEFEEELEDAKGKTDVISKLKVRAPPPPPPLGHLPEPLVPGSRGDCTGSGVVAG